jgi:hypothetical protein
MVFSSWVLKSIVWIEVLAQMGIGEIGMGDLYREVV